MFSFLHTNYGLSYDYGPFGPKQQTSQQSECCEKYISAEAQIRYLKS